MSNNESQSVDGRAGADNNSSRMATEEQHHQRASKRVKVTQQEQSAGDTAPTVLPALPSPSRPERVPLRVENEYRYYQAKSEPYGQWMSQLSEAEDELREIYVARGERVPNSRQLRKLAQTRVKLCWIRQGIWRKEWDTKEGSPKPKRKWKHEEPLKLKGDTNSGVHFGAEQRKKEIQDCLEKLSAQKRRHDASRPFHQFMSQISEECERIVDKAKTEGFNFDINTLAYEAVKSRWVKRGIWDRRWGTLPGMQWKHEESPESVERAFAAGTVPDLIGKDGKDIRVDAKYVIPGFPPSPELGNKPAPRPTRQSARKTARPAETRKLYPEAPVIRARNRRKKRPATRKKTNGSGKPSGNGTKGKAHLDHSRPSSQSDAPQGPAGPPVNNEPDPLPPRKDAVPENEPPVIPPPAATPMAPLKAEDENKDAIKQTGPVEESSDGLIDQSRRSRPTRKAAVAARQLLRDIGIGGPKIGPAPGEKTSKEKNVSTASRKRKREPAKDLPEKKPKPAPATPDVTLQVKSDVPSKKRKQESAEEPLAMKPKLSPDLLNSTSQEIQVSKANDPTKTASGRGRAKREVKPKQKRPGGGNAKKNDAKKK